MVVLRRLLLVLLGLRRVEMRLPLRPGTTAAYVSRNFEWDAARKCPQLISQCELALAAPVYFISSAILSTLSGAMEDETCCRGGDLAKTLAL